MKKLFLVMIGVAIFVATHKVLADNPKIIYDAKFDGKKFSIQNDGSYFINNKKAGSFIYDNSFLFHVYKSDKKNMLAVNVASEGSSKSRYWNLINLTDGKNFKIISNPNGVFEINGKNITASTKKNDCTGTQNMDSDYPTGSYKNKYIAPTFIGFKKDGKMIYQSSSPTTSEVFCERDCTKECVWSPSFYLSFEGLDKNLNNVYFSGQGYSTQGKNWTAYYAYNIKTNKIIKTTLANINKNKIKLTPVVVAKNNNNTKTYSDVTNKILLQEEGQILTYVNHDTLINGVKSGFSKNKFFVNNEPLFNDAYVVGDNFKLYKTNQKDTVELYYDLEEMGINRYWYIINLSSLSYTLVNESENESGDVDLYINNAPTNDIVAVKKSFIGMSADSNKIYFSGSANAKINYSYNLTTHKIIKEEPTDKIETTLVKTF